MPKCGSQVVLCCLPVRLDTYAGCGHDCAYCFTRAKRRDLVSIGPGESVKALRSWIAGGRTAETRWCDWRIPLHWGGMSDPFQPAELRQGRSLACLEVFAETSYPVVISTKGAALLADNPAYLRALSACDAVLQISMVSPRLDASEPGAPSFKRRLVCLPILARHCRRLNIRCQPYSPALLADVLAALPRHADAGVYGFTIEGLKVRTRTRGMVKLGPDYVWPVETLRADFTRIRARCHELGLRFYAAENRLRALGDDLCCCGVEGLGWRVNRANLNALVGGKPIRYTRRMQTPGTAGAFKTLAQNVVSTTALRRMSYADALGVVARVVAFQAVMGLTPSGPADGRKRPAVASDGAGRAVRPAELGRGAAKWVRGPFEGPSKHEKKGAGRVASTHPAGPIGEAFHRSSSPEYSTRTVKNVRRPSRKLRRFGPGSVPRPPGGGRHEHGAGRNRQRSSAGAARGRAAALGGAVPGSSDPGRLPGR
jgi:DNA repair photolyase